MLSLQGVSEWHQDEWEHIQVFILANQHPSYSWTRQEKIGTDSVHFWKTPSDVNKAQAQDIEALA